jgi:hypothetical protein
MNTIRRPSVPRSLPFAWQFVADYRRNPVDLLLLVLVPITFVVVAAPSMADAAELLGGPGGPMVETNTAGWAAGFLAGIAMYFHVAAREVDRRLGTDSTHPPSGRSVRDPGSWTSRTGRGDGGWRGISPRQPSHYSRVARARTDWLESLGLASLPYGTGLTPTCCGKQYGRD